MFILGNLISKIDIKTTSVNIRKLMICHGEIKEPTLTDSQPFGHAKTFVLPSLGPIPDRVGHTEIRSRNTSAILTRATGFMDEYDYTLNPYSGCSFGCTYCYAAFFTHNKRQRDTWGKWVDVKQNGIERIAKIDTGNLRQEGRYDGKLIYMSSVTDAYQPIERQTKLTRGILEVLAERHKPKLVVETRSPDVTRDIDLFQKIEERGGRVQVNMTVTTDDEDIRRTFEPYCLNNQVRLRAIQEVQDAGIQSCITMTPLLLVSDPRQFADDLLATCVKSFIIQPFHFKEGKFVANTREEATQLMADKLKCDIEDFIPAYMCYYAEATRIIQETLAQAGIPLGEGKEGFKPPF